MKRNLDPFSTRGATFNVVVWGCAVVGAILFAATSQPQLWPMVAGFAVLELVFIGVLLIVRRRGGGNPKSSLGRCRGGSWGRIDGR